MHLTEEEQSQINRLVAEAEAKSGIQMLIVIVARADAYPEIPWKGFAIGAVFAALAAMAHALYFPDWSSPHAGVLAFLVMGTGAAFAALTLFMPDFARLFLSGLRADAEVRQYAEAMFLQKSMFETRHRVGLLLLMARFEHGAAIVADSGVRQHLTPEQLAAVMAQAKPLLARERIVEACASCLVGITLALQDRLATAGTAANEIRDTLIQERGA